MFDERNISNHEQIDVKVDVTEDINHLIGKKDLYTKRYTKSISRSLDFLKEKDTLYEKFDLMPSAPKINTDEYSEKRSKEYMNTKNFT